LFSINTAYGQPANWFEINTVIEKCCFAFIF
jgi:hypothetical protein